MTVARIARVLRRQEAHERHEQQRRVQRVGLVVLHEDAALVDAVLEMSAWISSAAACQRSAWSCSSRMRARRAPRSHATQHMTFEDVKCLGSPRTSQIPRSGSRQCVDRLLDLLAEDRPEAVGQLVARLRVQVERVQHRRPTRRAGAGSRRRCRSAPAWRPRSRRGGRAPTPPTAVSPPIPYMIWRSCSPPGDVGDEVEEVVGLPVEAERVEAPQHERGVADPASSGSPSCARRRGVSGREVVAAATIAPVGA